MSGLRKVALVLLVALWVPATLHCRLESLPGLEFLSCCQHAGAEKTPSHHDRDCTADGCATVESGLYYKEDKPQRTSGTALQMLAVALLLMVDQEQPIRSIPHPGSPTYPPPLSKTWPFSSHAALPRAPSFVA